MKAVFGTMFAVFVCIVPLGGMWSMIFSSLIGGGVDQSFIYPIYGGIIVLSGIVVGCTKIVLHEIKSIHNLHNNTNNDK